VVLPSYFAYNVKIGHVVSELWPEQQIGKEQNLMQPPLPVLLIEDDEVDQELIQRLIQPYAHRFAVTAVPDAIRALELLPRAHLHFAIILLDLMLPRMNGFEFLHFLRQQPTQKERIVIVITGSNDEQDRLRAERYQIAGYFLKDKLGSDAVSLIQLLHTFK